MHIDELREFCLAKAGTSEELPFGPDTLVFKVLGKAFALVDIEKAESVNLKCDPEKALELRAQYPEQVHPGYHMNKKHWNTVKLGTGRLSETDIKELINHSYTLVVNKLPKKDQATLRDF